MTMLRKIYQGFMEASLAHARWDYMTSMNILKNRKKLLILLIMLSPILLVSLGMAGETA